MDLINDDSDDGIDCENNTEWEYATITAKIRNFSSEQIHRPNQLSEDYIDYDIQIKYPTFEFLVTIYANGSNNANKGYVSVIFRGYKLNVHYFDFNYFICVLDAAGNKRFSRSFSYAYDNPNLPPFNEDYFPVFGEDKYISRKTLLEEPSELLTNDILTLNIDIIVVKQLVRPNPIYFDLHAKPVFKTEEHCDGFRYYLCLDSIVVKYLRFESRYFECLLEISMKENETRYMSIPAEEYSSFVIIESFIIGATSVTVESVDDIFWLCAIADKYDIPSVTVNCLQLLREYLSFDSSADLLKLADEFFDGFDYLKESIKYLLNRRYEDIEVFRDLEEKHKFPESSVEYKTITEVNEHRSRDWCCEAIIKDSKRCFLFRPKSASMFAVKEIPDSAFDFYN